jgi:hypothetical protein
MDVRAAFAIPAIAALELPCSSYAENAGAIFGLNDVLFVTARCFVLPDLDCFISFAMTQQRHCEEVRRSSLQPSKED